MRRHFDNEYEWDEDEFEPRITSTHGDLINEIIQMTGAHIGHLAKKKSTPAPRGMILIKSDEKEEETNYTKYCSIAENALYLTTKIMIKDSNTV